MPTIILAIVCLILVIVLYVVSGGWKAYGGIRGIFKWAVATKNRDARGGTIRSKSESARVDEHAEAVEVLRELYMEFEDKYRVLNQKVDGLEQELSKLKREMPHVHNRDPFTQPFDHTDDTSDSDMSDAQLSPQQDLYFQILDLLESGRSDAEIVRLLSVEQSDVAYVRSIMFDPRH